MRAHGTFGFRVWRHVGAALLVGFLGCRGGAATKGGDPGTPAVAPGAASGAAASSAAGAGAAASGVAPGASGSSDAGAAASAAVAPARRPPPDLNVLFLTVDSLRADMPWAGYERPIAPRLTALEGKSVSYTRAYSLSSYTSMSLGGLLGGRLPSELRRDGYFFGTYPNDNLFFPELLQKAGVRTVAAHAHGYFGPKGGLGQGFDVWEMVPNLKWNNTTDENVTSPEHLRLAQKILSDPANVSGRFFAWFHFMDPHDKYQPHPGIAYGKKLRDVYDGEVTYTDEHLGQLLDFIAAQPWASRTAIVVSADHGEALGEHGQYVHGFEVWENLVHVPLFFVLPGVAPRRIAEPRSAVDLAPTFLDLFGLPPEPSFTGKSLVPELYGEEAKPREVLVDLPATSDNGRRRALVDGKWKLIVYETDGVARLFDLEADPGELRPITKGEDFQRLVSRYRELAKGIRDVAPYRCAEGCLNGAYRKKNGD